MALTICKKRQGDISRKEVSKEIELIIGNDEGTYGLRQFYRNPHLSTIALQLKGIENALTDMASRLRAGKYTLESFVSDLNQQTESVDALYKICVKQKMSSYLYSNRYHNDAENPWTQVSYFLGSSSSELGKLLEKARTAEGFSD